MSYIVNSYKAGATIAEIMERTGIARSTIRDVLVGAGVRLRKAARRNDVRLERDVINLYKRGTGTKMVAELCGISRERVRRILARNNIETRPAGRPRTR